RIERVLGAGGFGITYLATEIALDRSVTIKEYFPSDFAARADNAAAFPKSEACAPDYRWGLDRFIDEAKALARFDHPNIVRVFRYFRANDTAYMVLQFEEGAPLRAWQKQQPNVPKQHELDRIVGPLLDALVVLHRADVLHRDIAPDNIILRHDGSPVLIDFGSARCDVACQSRTVSALVKPGYSPYEQYGSDGALQGPWTDIYALGATLYHLTTGKRPPDAPSRIVSDAYVSARTAARGAYRDAFLDAIDRALANEIDARPQSVDDWRSMLFAGEVTDGIARAPGPRDAAADRSPSGASHNHPAATVAIGAAAPPAAPTVFQRARSRLRRREQIAAAEAPRAAVDPPAQKTPAPRPRPAAKPHAKTIAAQPVAPAERAAGIQWRMPTLPRLPAIRLPRLRQRSAPDSARKQRQLSPPANAHPPAPERAGGSGLGVLVPRRLSSMLRAAAPPPVAVGGADVAPPVRARPPERVTPLPVRRARDAPPPAKRARKARPQRKRSSRLAFTAKACIAVCFASLAVYVQQKLPTMVVAGSTVTTGTAQGPNYLRRQFLAHEGGADFVRFANDGTWLVTSGADATLKIWNARWGGLVRTLELDHGRATALAIGGRVAVTGHDRGDIAVYDLDDGTRLAHLKRNDARIWSVAFVDGDAKILAAGHDWTVALWSRDQPGAPDHLFGGHDNAVQTVAYDPTRQRILSGGADKVIKLWDRGRLSLVRTYRAHKDFVTRIAVAPDGERFASGDLNGRLRLWSTRNGKRLRRINAHADEITGLAFLPSSSPRKRLVATASRDGRLRIWNTRTSKRLMTLGSEGTHISDLSISTNGRFAATSDHEGRVRIWDISTVR
ncbi:MAG: protein kinase, partial [Pseudomonadota bacterium]